MNLDFCGECGVSINNNGSRYCSKCQQYIDTEALVLRHTFPDTDPDTDLEIESEEILASYDPYDLEMSMYTEEEWDQKMKESRTELNPDLF